MNFKYCLTGMLLLSMKISGQEIKPLSIGDRLPSINITNILNYPALQSNLSEYKHKLVILNFMATTCSGCLKLLPRFDSLQRLYGDQIKIILISNEKSDRIQKFLANNPTGKKLKLPIIGEDTILSKYFPFIDLSHEVWIKDGVVKAITSTDYVTAKNIQTVLAGEAIKWPVKNDLPKYDYSKPLIFSQERAPKFYSIITGFIKNASYKHSMLMDTVGQWVRTRLFNQSVTSLFLRSYGLKVFPESFILLEVKDTSKYLYDLDNPNWKNENTYCYESLLPLTIAHSQRMKKLRSDVKMFFAVDGKIETRKILCNVIVKNHVQNVSLPSGNTSFSTVLSVLNSRYFKTPYINESGFTGKIFIDPAVSILSDEDAVLKALRNNGFEIKKEVREVKVFVLRENDFQKNLKLLYE